MTEKATSILILYSWDDDVSQRRIELLRSSQITVNLEINQCFAMKGRHDTPEQSFIYNSLKDAVDIYNPSVILLHTGLAFQRDPASFVEAIRKIRTLFSTIKLGIEERPFSLELRESNLFDRSDFVKNIESIIFRQAFGRSANV